MNANPTLYEYQASATASSKDGLFLERLETFLEKSLSDIRAFADRESQPFDETRRCIARWHAKYLFQPSDKASSSALNSTERPVQIRSVLCDASRILETLSESSGVQAFLLAIDPHEFSDGGFLGGSMLGREFWRGLRGGGEPGARSFRVHCTAQLQRAKVKKEVEPMHAAEQPVAIPPPTKTNPAKSVKNELYENVRNALRSISGIRTAEMKWTNPERLDAYGVRLVGWPEGVPAQNPSSLKTGQNRLLLEAMRNGSMRFERLSYVPPLPTIEVETPDDESSGTQPEPIEDFSWAYDADAGLSSAPQDRAPSTTTASSSSSNAGALGPTISVSSIHENGSFEQEVWNLHDNDLVSDTAYNTDYPWGDEFHDSMHSLGAAGSVWDGEEQSDSERPRKRPRSEEPFNEMDHDARLS